jgi:hypothetical protein
LLELARLEEGHSRFNGVFFEDFFSFDCAVEIDCTTGTGALAQGCSIFPHFITGPPGELKGRTGLFLIAIEDIPTGGEDHQITQACEGEAPIVDQTIDLIDLGHIKIGIKPVVGVFLS